MPRCVAGFLVIWCCLTDSDFAWPGFFFVGPAAVYNWCTRPLFRLRKCAPSATSLRVPRACLVPLKWTGRLRATGSRGGQLGVHIRPLVWVVLRRRDRVRPRPLVGRRLGVFTVALSWQCLERAIDLQWQRLMHACARPLTFRPNSRWRVKFCAHTLSLWPRTTTSGGPAIRGSHSPLVRGSFAAIASSSRSPFWWQRL